MKSKVHQILALSLFMAGVSIALDKVPNSLADSDLPVGKEINLSSANYQPSPEVEPLYVASFSETHAA